ncbi:MAG: ribosome-associated translation inhibitor RaiA [Candidatus Eisenbacteria bacterium]|nr:ribosome-associated translation inhibitor RaiA [Candidatus Eisenbacteria bacterium]
MRIRVTSRHVEVDDALRAYVEEKTRGLSRYFDRVDEANVVLSAEGHRKVAALTVHASRATISSEQDGDDVRSAFDNALEKVQRQVRRHKARVRDHKHGVPTSDVAEELAGAPPSGVGIVPETLAAEPMTPEAAVAELSAASVGFLVFLNSETGKVNVLYRRDDGHYGLVEPGGSEGA